MRELHVVAISEDGAWVQLATTPDALRGGFRVALDDRLAAAVRGDLPRPGETTVRDPLPVKEIQARLRAGETPEQIARSAGTPVARVERWASPVESEKQQVVLAARQSVLVRGKRGPSAVPLGEAVDRHLAELPTLKADSVAWTARRGDAPQWTVEVSWFSRGKTRSASWTYDPHTRELSAGDAASAALGHVDAEPAARPSRTAAAVEGAADAGPRLPAGSRRAPTASAFPRTAQSRTKAAGGKRGVASGAVTSTAARQAAAQQADPPAARSVVARPAAAPAAPKRKRAAAAAPPPERAVRTAPPRSATAARPAAPARRPAAQEEPAAAPPAVVEPAAPEPVAPPALRVVGSAPAPEPTPAPSRRRASVPSWDEVLLSTGSREDTGQG